MTRHRFLGLPLDDLTLAEALARLEQQVRARAPAQHMVLNAMVVVLARRDEELRRAIEASAVVQADGQSVVWAARLLGVPVPERVAGIDLMAAALERADRLGLRVYLLGARPERLAAATRTIVERWPALVLAGTQHGYFAAAEESAVAERIRAAGADLLFVGLPTPQKELFIQRHLDRMQVPFCLGVGGSLDVFAGAVKRAPRSVQRAGLEWAWRLGQEPRRLWKRYLVTNSRFLAAVLRAWLSG